MALEHSQNTKWRPLIDAFQSQSMAKLRRSLRKLAKTKLDDRQEDQERILTEVWRHQTTGLYLLATAKLTDSFIARLSYKCFYNVYIGVGGMGHFSPRGGPLFAPCTTLLKVILFGSKHFALMFKIRGSIKVFSWVVKWRSPPIVSTASRSSGTIGKNRFDGIELRYCI